MAFSGVDEQIKCADCGKEFLFSTKDQEFYERQGFTDKPKRCKTCRDLRKQKKGEQSQAQQPVPDEVMDEYRQRFKSKHRRG
jgi:hypothetical protein